MHVVWTPSWYPSPELPLNGSFFREQAGLLRDVGTHVGVIALDAEPRLRTHLPWSLTEEEGIGVVRGSVGSVPPRATPGQRLLVRRAAHRAAALYEGDHGVPDLVHAHSAFPGVLLADELSRLWEVPFVLTEHRPSSFDRPRHTLRHLQLRGAVHRASARLGVSEAMCAVGARYYRTPPWEAVALPAPSAFFDTPLPGPRADGTFRFVHVSHVDDNKRVPLTLRAFREVHLIHPRARLGVVGGSPERVAPLEALARDLGIDAWVEFAGSQPRQALPGLMAQADAFVLASAVEAGGTVLAEAQAAGLACVATRTWAGRFMVEPATGLTVPVDDVEALAGAMSALVDDPGERPPAAVRARAAQRFSPRAFTSHLLGIYARVLAGPGTRH